MLCLLLQWLIESTGKLLWNKGFVGWIWKYPRLQILHSQTCPLLRGKQAKCLCKLWNGSQRDESLTAWFSGSWSECISGSTSYLMLKAAGSRARAPSSLHHPHMPHITGHRSLCSTALDMLLCQAYFRMLCSWEGIPVMWRPGGHVETHSPEAAQIHPLMCQWSQQQGQFGALEIAMNTVSATFELVNQITYIRSSRLQGLYLCWGG